MKLINNLIAFAFASVLAASASAQVNNLTYTYGCQQPEDWSSLRLYAGHLGVDQQPGGITVAMTLTKLDTSVYPPASTYPSTAVLFMHQGPMTADTPFGGDLLCLPRATASPTLWFRNEQLFNHPVYLTSVVDGVIQSGPVSFQAWMRAPGGFELSNAVSLSL